MKRLSMVLLLLCAIAPATLAESNDEKELQSVTQSVLVAVAHGDTMAWERNLHRDFIVVDARGNLVTRARTAPDVTELSRRRNDPGRQEAVIVRRIGNIAVIHYRDPEGGHAAYQNTVTYVKVGGQWKLAASHLAARK